MSSTRSATDGTMGRLLRRTAAALVLAAGLAIPAPVAAAEAGGAIQRDKGSGIEVLFVPYPWRPDLFQAFEEGGSSAHGWAFARLVVSSSFALEGTRLYPGNYAVVLNPRTGAIPMSLELRRVGGREFLEDVPAMAAAPPGETVYKRPAAFTQSPEPAPVLDLSIASWNEGSLLTIRWGNRKLVKELPRSNPY